MRLASAFSSLWFTYVLQSAAAYMLLWLPVPVLFGTLNSDFSYAESSSEGCWQHG